ncbi:MAG: response regulator [Brevundimonas sp.]|uniref:response regulator n=1 Tax=Brevundimonas sp. TaxID=1871086 RepID=UPI00262A4B18|nr:response regulator [Brevundimonas sp.]MDI6624649.1 response regulator [Brevundimonas sp.]MDQ7812210.1 response regulator [Brevundimonas sp.]
MAIIVIVDDDPTIQFIAGELLKAEGHAIVHASDGVEALKVLRTVPADLVVLDMLMPNMDGLETIMEMQRTHPETKILAISSGGPMGPQDLLRTAKLFGADDTLVKPLTFSTFGAAVERLLNKTDRDESPFANIG